MARRLGTDTITVQRVTTSFEPYSATYQPDWSLTPTERDVKGCDYQPGASTEYLIGRDFSEVGGTVYAPSGTDVTEYDRVKFQGVVYDVDGKPDVWSGRMGHVVIHLKVRKG
ncbi:hypothetical protein [Arthrobacter sp. NA-172]|uniref:hypothetical protein n=1 Tax=Arthrobacter sp. NA-172 TaxID=3367524 RepID=UPI0037540DA5